MKINITAFNELLDKKYKTQPTKNQRHHVIYEIIKRFKPKTIIETGVYKGKNAASMIGNASIDTGSDGSGITYWGYDMFEDIDMQTSEYEFHTKGLRKPQPTYDNVRKLISNSCPKAEINLVRGNTKDTLPYTVADLAFIDGGHSIDTIQRDYEKLKDCKVIIFDDYYRKGDTGKSPDTEKFGANKLLEKIKHYCVETNDGVTGEGKINLGIIINEDSIVSSVFGS
jgi:hypothetical protein